MDLKVVGELLRQERKNRKITLEDLEQPMGLTNGYLSRIERGAVENLKIGTLEKFLKILEIDFYDFMNDVQRLEEKFYPGRKKKLKKTCRSSPTPQL